MKVPVLPSKTGHARCLAEAREKVVILSLKFVPII